MRTLLSSHLLLFSLFVIGCSEETVSVKSEYNVSGYVVSKGVAVENAIVSLDGNEIRKTATDGKGYFKLVSIPRGNYKLTILKSNNSGSFSEDAKYIDVEGDLYLDYLILPKGITVFQPEIISQNSFELIWSATNASSFREYKIYQHSSSGLDETTGTLIHVSTSINDTIFTVKDLNPLTDYYFRVYVMNDFGRLGGSNIISAKTENLELIDNGSFEFLDPSTGFPNNWTSEEFGGSVLVDSSEATDGRYSVSVNGYGFIKQEINPSELIAGSKYRFVCYIKHDSLSTPTYSEEIVVFLQQSGFIDPWGMPLASISDGTEASEWKEYSFEFTMATVEATNFAIYVGANLFENTRAWFDNMSLIKVE